MGAGVSQQTISRAARKRLQTLQAEFNKSSLDGRAVYLAVTKQRYPEIVFPDGTVASVTVIRASNGEAYMQLIVWPAGQSSREAKPPFSGATDLDFVKKLLS